MVAFLPSYTLYSNPKVLVSSKALEITLESAVGSVISAEREEALSQLLATFIPSAGPALVHSLVRVLPSDLFLIWTAVFAFATTLFGRRCGCRA